MGGLIVTNENVSVGEVRDLGGGKFSVQLSIEGPEGTVSRTETVSAHDRGAAVQTAKKSFSRWLKKATDYILKNMPSKMRH
jgi:hypothetical protein